jgi:hypothetical protein
MLRENYHGEISPLAFILFCAVLVVSSICGCNSAEKSVLKPQSPRPGNGEVFSLDLNDDGADDFVFEYSTVQTTDIPSSASSVFLSVVPKTGNSVRCKEGRGPEPLADGTLIDDTLTWTNYHGSLTRINWSLDSGWDQAWSGAWAGVSEMSLGLEIIVDDSNHFGWVKLSVDLELGTLTVHDYAYQPIPGEPILAGVQP